MPQGPDGNTIIVIKKVIGHSAAHGGSWKVAYADFVTSMMALFMTLWLVSAAPDAVREVMAEYFKYPGLFSFDKGASAIQLRDNGVLERKISNEPSETVIEEIAREHEPGSKASEAVNSSSSLRESAEAVAKNITASIEKMKSSSGGKMGDISGNISITVDDQGLHIDIMDSKKTAMFELGKDAMSIEAQHMMYRIAQVIKDLPNIIDISGHTDSVQFSTKFSSEYDNWYLSTDRANAARKMFMRAGIAPERIARVIGFADTQPKDKENLNNPANRRITITLHYDDDVAKKLQESNSGGQE